MSLVRCVRCVYPNTKPDLFFDAEGVCSGCRAFEKRPEIDWASRRRELTEILDKHDGQCIVASSGGKDSTYIALTLIEMGARPVIVTATTDHLSDIGKRNIQNLARFAETIEVTPNQTVRRKIARIGLLTVGDISYGEHLAIWTTPFQMAKKIDIPLIFYGESPQNEMGGPPGSEQETMLTPRWRAEFGGLLGMRATDLVGQDGITERDIEPYVLPSDLTGITAYFLGQFLPWDGLHNAEYAREHGFGWFHKDVEGSIGAYESLDNHQTGLHEWFKFLKYSYMRPTDIASLAIRRGRMTRDEALALIEEREVFPTTYLGLHWGRVLHNIGVDAEAFKGVCRAFTNYDIFEKTEESWCKPIRRFNKQEQFNLKEPA